MALLAEKQNAKFSNYPRFNLETCLDKLKIIWAKEKQHFVAFPVFCKHLGYSPKSSGANCLIAALNSFGLIESKGSKETRQFKVNDRALRIFAHPEEKVRLSAIKEAALLPKIYSAIMQDYTGLPTNTSLEWYLRENKGFEGEASIKDCTKNFFATMAFARLNDSVNDSEIQSAEVQTSTKTEEIEVAADPNYKTEIFNLDDGKTITIKWPVTYNSDETDLNQWLDIVLRKVKRANASKVVESFITSDNKDSNQ